MLYFRNKALERKQKNLYKHLQEITLGAQAKAEEIVEEASKRAGKTLAESVYLKTELSKHLETSLKDSLQAHLDTLRQESEQLDKDYREVLKQAEKKALETTEEEVQKDIKSLREVITQEILDSHTQIQQTTNKEMDQIKNQMESYKKEQLQIVDAQVNSIIQKVAKDVIGKTLSVSEHEDLVLEALDEAKKEGVFKG